MPDVSQLDSLKRDWNVSNSEAVLQLISDEVHSTLREVEKSLGKEKTPNLHSHTTHENSKFEVYESLKWFVTAEDFRNRQPRGGLMTEGLSTHENFCLLFIVLFYVRTFASKRG